MGSVLQVFFAFLKLGLTCFGGPVAHIGYFREEFVVRRRWLDDGAYADLVALCQFLPGPASSQIGFSLGVLRGNGILGGLAAWVAFTLPSAAILVAFAYAASTIASPVALAVIHGLKLVAVAVVAQALWGMTRALTPDRQRGFIAMTAMAVILLVGGPLGQVGAIVLGALIGLRLCRSEEVSIGPRLEFPVSKLGGGLALAAFAALLVIPPIVAGAGADHAVALFDAFYRSGALVFGGGHVVLPLLRDAVVTPGWLTIGSFLTGYGAAQTVPGPLFAFAAYLGAVMTVPPNGILGAVIALTAIFLPGLLLVYGMLPYWQTLRAYPAAQAAMRGANAAVVGILGAAFYDPIWTGAVLTPVDFLLALDGFLLLTVWRMRPFFVVLLLAIAGGLSTIFRA